MSRTFWRAVWQMTWRRCAMAALASVCALAQAEPPRVYTVEVVPQFPAVDITQAWGPVLARLGALTGATFTLKLAKDIPAFERDVLAGTPDFTYLNPYHQWMAHRAQGYVPLVHDREALTGILVVRQDDPITRPAALQGQRVAFPAPNAFGASLLIRAQLAERDHVKIEPYYAKTHTNAYRQVVTGQTRAAGGVRATLEREPEAVRRNLRVLFETEGAAPHPLSAHPRVPEALRKAVTQAMLTLSHDPTLHASLAAIPMPEPVEASQARDYDTLEQLHLDRYVE
jgi:phosphonate transport system substrate-binding protein